MAETANDLMPGDEVDGHEVATVSRSGTDVRITFTDKRLNPRVLERWEPVPDTVDGDADAVDVAEPEDDEGPADAE